MNLKHYHILIFIGLCAASCHLTKQPRTFKLTEDPNAVYDTIQITNENLEHEIIILEVGFNGWLATQRPRGFYTQNYLENRNRFYVVEYNSRYSEPRRYDRDLYPFRINYSFDI